MNTHSPEPERSPLDYIHFALIFVGLGTTAAGVVSMTIPIAVIGAAMLLMGAGYFLFTYRPS